MNQLFDVSKLKVFKLINGDELIGSLVSETDQILVFHKPMRIQLISDGEGSINIAFLKYINLTESEWIPFNKNMIVTVVSPSKDAHDYYITGLKNEMISWMEDESGEEQAQKDFKELEAIANDEGPKKELEKTPEDEKNINPEAGEEIKGLRHRRRTKKKPFIN